MGSSNRDLLHLEHKNLSDTSALESALLVYKTDSVSDSKKSPPDGKPLTSAVGPSQVLGKVKDFLGVISEANKKLQRDSKENNQNYDIEVLKGTESEVIEMDLMLGIADLRTPEALAAAESAISSSQRLVPPDSDSSEMESEGTSSDDENDEADSEDDNNDNDNDKTSKRKMSKFGNGDSSQAVRKNGSKKRPKIIEMS